MAVEVLIKRKIKQGGNAKKMVPLILQMRALALHQLGYISGKTLCDLEHPGDCLVISLWETVDDWNRWKHTKERTHIESKIEALTGEETHYNIYAPMTASQTD
jgi:heme-degrading monooxygenase HmoA